MISPYYPSNVCKSFASVIYRIPVIEILCLFSFFLVITLAGGLSKDQLILTIGRNGKFYVMYTLPQKKKKPFYGTA